MTFRLTLPHRAPTFAALCPRAVAQLGRALRSGRRGREFESRQPDHQQTLAVTWLRGGGSPVLVKTGTSKPRAKQPAYCHLPAPCLSQPAGIVETCHALHSAAFSSVSRSAPVKKRILTADDEMDVLMLLETRLSASGYEVLKATDGIAALARARADQPALAVLDVMMPGMSGLEVRRALKADPKTARMPIIMLTARHEEVDRVLGFEFGADDYVLKPFSPRELALHIQALLRHQLQPVVAPSALVTLGPISVDRFAHLIPAEVSERLEL